MFILLYLFDNLLTLNIFPQSRNLLILFLIFIYLLLSIFFNNFNHFNFFRLLYGLLSTLFFICLQFFLLLFVLFYLFFHLNQFFLIQTFSSWLLLKINHIHSKVIIHKRMVKIMMMVRFLSCRGNLKMAQAFILGRSCLNDLGFCTLCNGLQSSSCLHIDSLGVFSLQKGFKLQLILIKVF